MDFLASPLGVMAILALVAVAAFAYQPAKYVAPWREIAALYETERRPASIAFPGEDIALGLYELARIDAAVDDEGFWMIYNGPDPNKAPPCTLIPWECIRFRQAKESKYHFQIRTKKIAELYVSPELGAALQRRSEQYPVESPL